MNIKQLREKKNLTQDELSSQTGIPRARIAKWEQNKGKPKAEDLKTLEKFFSEKVEEVPEVQESLKEPLERAIENLTETDRINARSIERLIYLLEVKMGVSRKALELPPKGTPGTTTLTEKHKKTGH